MSQNNIDYSVGPALTMEDLYVPEVEYSVGPALTMEDLHVPTIDDAPLSLSDLDIDVSVIEGDNTPMSIYDLDDSIMENDNDEPFTLSELDMSFIENCDTSEPVKMGVDETVIIDTNECECAVCLSLDCKESLILDENDYDCECAVCLAKDGIEAVSIDTDECECAVCLEPINKSKNIAITKCRHTFCFQCIGQTLMDIGNNCPLCRAELVEYNNVDDDETLGSEDTESELDEDNDYISDDESVYSVSNLGSNNENDLGASLVRISDAGFVKGPIKEITDRFVEKGYTCYDLMTILFQQYDKNTTKDVEAITRHISKTIEDLRDINTEEQEIVEMNNNDIAVV